MIGRGVASVVVVPARDEEARIAACIEALAAQTTGVDAFEVIVVADACGDRTEAVARAVADRHGVALSVLAGAGTGTGPARRLGMDAAAARLAEIGRPDGLIATTDADSVPAADWLERQIAHVRAGAQVIAGMIELDVADASGLPDSVLVRRRADAAQRMAAVLGQDDRAAHHHFAGASLGITVDTYRAVGGLEATPALEDEVFAQRLTAHGVPILRPADVVVETAARTDGRAQRGLAVDLAVSVWRERRRYRAADYSQLARAGRADGVTVIIPTKQCATTITGVLTHTVEPLRERGLVDRVVVIDADSADGTADIAAMAGAEVIQQDQVRTELGPAVGKGDAMWRALGVTGGDIVCFLDGDTADPTPDHLLGLLGPLLDDATVQLVKGAFERPMLSGEAILPHEGGRVTELTARPLLNLHFPLLAGFAQPLAGEFAARRSLLEQLSFPVGYGVEIAVLIDALRMCGLDALAESHLGTRQNRHQSLRALSEMAFAVLAAVENRLSGARSITTGQYLRPWEDGTYVRVPVAERPAAGSLPCVGGARRSPSAASQSG
jgi:glycosyltransferase involved in cell wall biosynthesis